MPQLSSPPIRRGLLLLGLVVSAGSCGGDVASPTRVDQTGASRARSAATTLSVASVSPDTGALATTVDVHIFGHGFSDGVAARWALDGVPDSNQVKTNST